MEDAEATTKASQAWAGEGRDKTAAVERDTYDVSWPCGRHVPRHLLDPGISLAMQTASPERERERGCFGSLSLLKKQGASFSRGVVSTDDMRGGGAC